MNTQTRECCSSLERGWAERPRFFPRQLVTPDDLTLAQDYLRHKLRRHNRLLHGWGVVCGAKVVLPEKPAPWKVVIEDGYILGPQGDEIVIERGLCFDLRTRCGSGEGDPCAPAPADPWCADGEPEPRPAGDVFVAVRYREALSRPVRVQPLGCGCGDEAHCEYSRWRDGYEVCVLDECPESHHAAPPRLEELGKPGPIPGCPPCPHDPWVVLAAVKTDASGNVLSIDNCSCRRLVVSLAPYWRRCQEPLIEPVPGKDADGKERPKP
jgi:hypothetical protein